MFQDAYYWAAGFAFTNFVGVMLYWLPLAFCLIGFTMKSISDYYVDKRARDEEFASKPGNYHPRLFIGTIVGRLFASVVPVLNIVAAIFHVLPFLWRNVLGKIFLWWDKVLDIPLVPKREAKR